MSTAGLRASALAVLDGRSQARLVRLLFSRLTLTLLSFGIAVGLDGLGAALAPEARRGLYLTVSVAFAATILSGIMLPRVRRVDRFASLQIAMDVGIVSSLVHFSGGRESVFTFLYIVVTLYGAVLFERRGAMVAASLSALAYGLLLFGARFGLVSGLAKSVDLPFPVLCAIWGVHVGALYLVGVLASLLSTELQRTGRALDQSKSDLLSLRDLHQRTVESIMSGLLTTDGEGLITSFNPEAERITGRCSSEAIGKDVEAVIPGASSLVLNPRQEPSPADNTRARLRYRNRQNEELFLGLAASILKDAAGKSQGHVVIFQDLTDVVAMERGLRRSERLAAVGEMAAKIAHEIRNPLASISGSIQILGSLQTHEDGDAESVQLMDIVVRETDRLNSLITDFLQYSRPTPLAEEEVGLAVLLDEHVKILEVRRPENIAISARTELAAAVMADPNQLRQVLWNLSINALQAMPNGGELHLSLEECPGDLPQEVLPIRRNGAGGALPGVRGGRPCVEIVVRDTGDGVSDEVQEQIFEPFFTTKREGTGLGLATVHRIVESHGGALLVESELGRGTTFRVRLPRAEEGR